MDGQQAAATLGVDQRATREQIRRAFRARAKLLHPDTGPAGSMERFIGLRLAFEHLMAGADNAPVGRFDVGSPGQGQWKRGIDLTDTPGGPLRRTDRDRPRPRDTARRDARGLSFADHLAAALSARG